MDFRLRPFTPSRSAGLSQLARFLPISGADYAKDRNLHRPGHPHVSMLSPYLRHRLLTEAEVIAKARAAQGDDADAFVGQILWRSYWKGWLQMRPLIWRDVQSGVIAGLRRLETDHVIHSTYEAACHGRTGIDGFDAWAQALRDTGYLHNHQRLCFASIWIFTLRLPWELGADFFLRHLIDGDPASNTLSWRWVAGLHTPGKPYLAQASVIEGLSHGMYRPQGLAPHSFDVSGRANPEAGPCPQGGLWDHTLPTALLLHDEDLSPDWLLDAGLRPLATAFLIAPSGRSPQKVSPLIDEFQRDAVHDCARRRSADLGPLYGPVFGRGAVDRLTEWARETEAVQIITPFAAVGPVASLLDSLDTRLAAEKIRLIRAMRPYDAALWPHATHGYHRFREAVRGLI